MFKKNAGFREGVDTLIGFNTTFTGNITSEGSIRIDGKVKGDIQVTGDVYIGENSVIKGNIDSANVHLSGTVEGNITAKGVLKILSTAKLYGDIKVNSFVADEGALFQGKCNMTDSTPVDSTAGKSIVKKNYKKSTVLEEVYDDKDDK